VERPVPEASIDFFAHHEVAALLQVASERAQSGRLLSKLLACCVHLAIHTGLRKGELLGLRWQDLDLQTRRLTVARSYQGTPKSGKPRHLRLPAACVPMLREWAPLCPPTPEGLVFPLGDGDPHSPRAMLGLPGLLKAAGCRVPAHPWHAMRHTFASHFIMRGGNILTLQKILGHSDVKMTMIYAHLAPDFLAEEMDRLDFSALRPRPASSAGGRGPSNGDG
jgi:integrase